MIKNSIEFLYSEKRNEREWNKIGIFGYVSITFYHFIIKNAVKRKNLEIISLGKYK